MKAMFEKTGIGSLDLGNRFVRSATWEGQADEEGKVTGDLIETLAELARGHVGLVIAGFAFVSENGRAIVQQTGIYRDDLVPGLKAAAEAIHQAGGKIVAQIAHGGIQSMASPAGPSAIEMPGGQRPPHALEPDEIATIIGDFGQAAGRAKAAGFDAVQLHMAHGYLLSQFLSPYFNKRTDGYGGTPANRARACIEAYEAARGAVGPDFPILIKINADDFLPGGLGVEESAALAVVLAEKGLDAVEVSGGTLWSGRYSPSRLKIDRPEREAYFREFSKYFKEKLGIPVILVGGLRSPAVIEDVLSKNEADLIALSRPLIREPGLVRRWEDGDTSPAACISCGRCFQGGLEGRGVCCAILEKTA